MSRPDQRNITRRQFLARIGAGGAGLTAAWLTGVGVAPASASGVPAEHGYGVLIDLTRCVGCGTCALRCKQVNGLADPYSISRDLNEAAFSCIQVHRVTIANDETRTVYVKRNCMHCLHPGCVSACTVGALRKTPQGPVVYDPDKCIGCRYCQCACPFGVPTFQWEETLGLISKCQFCCTRLEEGQGPACAEVCPNGALQFGRRDALLVEAHRRLAAESDRYVNHVYGEHEAGGTALLYLSPVPFTDIGFPKLGPKPIPQDAEAVMTRTPLIALTVASIMTGANWLAKRQQDRAAATHKRETDAGEGQ